MAIKAICVACGKPKGSAFIACKACGFQPETEYQMARALIFSLPSAISPHVGRDRETLKQLSRQITGCRPYEFDPNEVESALGAYRSIKEEKIAKKKKKKMIIILLVLALLFGLIAFSYPKNTFLLPKMGFFQTGNCRV